MPKKKKKQNTEQYEEYAGVPFSVKKIEVCVCK